MVGGGGGSDGRNRWGCQLGVPEEKKVPLVRLNGKGDKLDRRQVAGASLDTTKNGGS